MKYQHMKIKHLLPFILFILIGISANGQNIKIYNSFESFEPLLHKSNDTTYVVNFWATWCAPCVKEMPAFKKAFRDYQREKVQFIMTSMDFGGNVRSRVSAFLEKHQMPQGMKVVILDDPKSNSWINKVSRKWSGALPATLVYNNSSRSFYEQEFTYTELKKIIQSKIK